MTDTKEKSWKYVVVLLLCIGVNFGGRILAEQLVLPFRLDMAGTFYAACFLGLPGTLLAAVLSALLCVFTGISAAAHILTGAVCALVLSRLAKKHYLDRGLTVLTSSLVTAVCCTCISVVLNLIVQEGLPLNSFGDELFHMLEWKGAAHSIAALLAEFAVQLPDKQLCMMGTWLFILLIKKNSKAIQKQIAALLAAVLCVCTTGSTCAVYAGELQDQYCNRIFNNQNGMMVSTANVVEETKDGVLWIGSYAGLTRYDGSDFEFITDGGFANVTDMLCDTNGVLWIGTNDGGIAKYENGSYTFFNTDDGLSSDSIRCICEGDDGRIYVGTKERICVIDENDTISIYNDEVAFPYSMMTYDDMLVCVGSDGILYLLKDGELIATSEDMRYDGETLPSFYCIGNTSMGILVGTIANQLYEIEIQNESLIIKDAQTLAVHGIHDISEDRSGRVWICGDDGFGYMANGTYHPWKADGFASSIENVHEDYQGNIWVASSSYGVLCLSQTPFFNIFSYGELADRVCNAVIPYQGGYCVGTDTGLLILDSDGQEKHNALTDMLDEDRIRAVYLDSQENLWICTYSEHGLVRMSADGRITCYNTESSPLVTSSRTRCICEGDDGTIAVGTSDGIFFIQNEEVTGCITQSDGLVNSQILSLKLREDGCFYAGSDGAGIYVIKDQKIVQNYTTDDGLSSNVIMRTIDYDGGFFAVTSNALCYFKDGKAVRLTEFPFYDNFDILLDKDIAYVLSAAGIYVCDVQKLMQNAVQTYSLYDVKYGFESALCANSWNYIGEDGKVYACTNQGVTRFAPMQTVQSDYRYGITSVTCDGEPLFEITDQMVIPSGTASIVVEGSLRNYALADVLACFFVEGQGIEQPKVSYKGIQPIRIVNPETGTYKVHFQVYNADGTILLSEQIYELKIEPQKWESPLFLGYLALVVADAVICFLIVLFLLLEDNRRKKQLAEFNATLEQKVKEQTVEIRAQNEKINRILDETVTALAKAVDAKDHYTSGHSKRVAIYSKMLAKEMGKSEEEQEEIYRTAILHDVGKINVPLDIINKPGKLTDEEYDIIKTHPDTGYRILKEITSAPQLAEGAWYHQERYDGRGYPQGLKGEEIPEIGRIIGVADAYDAMASNRSYRNALPQHVVREEIEKGRGTQFDPIVADIMLRIIDEDKDYQLKEPEKEIG